MKPEDFELFAKLVKQRSGLLLSADKTYLLQSRLMPIARELSLKTLDELATLLRAKSDPTLPERIAELMTTNESSFFRDQRPFDQFRNTLLPLLLKTRAASRKIRIWSAASSSGQEAYSLAILLTESASRLQGWTVEILGTDLSREMVRKAESGIYTQFEVQRGLPVTTLVKHFTQLGTDQWQINPALRAMVHFQYGNLLEPISSLGTFDIVFCRNVLIYLDGADKTRVLNAIHSQLAPHGALFLGGAETVLGFSDRFISMEGERGLYVPKPKVSAVITPPPTSAPLALGTLR